MWCAVAFARQAGQSHHHRFGRSINSSIVSIGGVLTAAAGCWLLQFYIIDNAPSNTPPSHRDGPTATHHRERGRELHNSRRRQPEGKKGDDAGVGVAANATAMGCVPSCLSAVLSAYSYWVGSYGERVPFCLIWARGSLPNQMIDGRPPFTTLHHPIHVTSIPHISPALTLSTLPIHVNQPPMYIPSPDLIHPTHPRQSTPPIPTALTDRPAKQPISAGDASTRRLLLPVYQSQSASQSVTC